MSLQLTVPGGNIKRIKRGRYNRWGCSLLSAARTVDRPMAVDGRKEPAIPEDRA
jgi:hypothetical protein